MIPWFLITTERGREFRVYERVMDIADDAWLPEAPRFIRLPKSKAYRELWQPILPGLFFAAIPYEKLFRLSYVDHCTGLVRDAYGIQLEIDPAQLQSFRVGILLENAARTRQARSSEAPKPVVKREPSRRLNRKGKKAEKLAEWVDATRKAAMGKRDAA